MSGRMMFKYIKPLILFFVCVLKMIPVPLRLFLFSLFSSIPTILGVLVRYILLKSMAKQCGNNVYIGRWCTLKNPKNLIVGDNVSIHEYCFIDAQGGISIGDNVAIAHNCSIVSFEHSFDNVDLPIKYQPLKFKSIVIHENVWLGCGVRVLAGSSLGQRSIFAANAVTKGQLDGGHIYAGAPAKVVKDI